MLIVAVKSNEIRKKTFCVPAKPIPWKWTEQRELAAKLLAEDKLSDEEIAKRIGINDATLWQWRKKPEFTARIDQYVNEYRARIRRSGIAVVENRIAKLAAMEQRMERLIAARAAAYAAPEIPGGDTGLVVKEIKGIGSKEDFRIVEEYKFDKGLANEYREYLKQAAQDLGQWSEKGEAAGADRLNELIEIARNGSAKAKPVEEESEGKKE